MQQRAISKVIGILLGAVGMALMPVAQAQYSANYQTNLISGVTSNWPGSYIVGSNTFLDALQIANGGVLSNGTGYIGYETSSSNNVASVATVGSVWSNAHNFYVGYSGAGNQLVITNGGSLVCGPNFPDAGYIGFNSSSSNNAVLISGSGSVWKTGDRVYLGENGAGNWLTITNGGLVSCSTVYVGDQASSSSNRILVSGSGSVLTNTGDLNLGWSGGGNSMIVSNGGKVFGGYIGYGYVGEYSSSSNNTVLVTGTNSLWAHGGDLYLGYGGGSNSLTISSGGSVSNNYATLGNSSASNSVLVTGSGSVWSNSGGVSIGFGIVANYCSVTISNGATVYNSFSADVGHGGSYCRAVIVGGGSVWTNGGSLNVGFSGAANTMTITSGGTVYSTGGTIGGPYSISANNVVAIIGSGSVWSNSGDLVVGNTGSLNQFILFNGGSAYNGNAYVGNSGSYSLASTFGGGSVWYNSGNLYIGYSSDINHLQVGSSSTVVASNAYVGYNGGSFNLVDVQGGNFYVTNAAHNAVLEVRCGQLNVSSGLLQVDILVCTNACGHISHTGGTLIVGSLVLDPNLSAVGDGIPNGWKQQYSLDPLNPNVANQDVDGDGMSNLQEFLAGTDPTNSASSFRITSVAGIGSDVLISWMTGIGKTNALQATVGSSYATNGFADIFTVTNTVGTTTNYLDVGGATNKPARYYRVRLVP
jgi:T5SS/PEP-CTERM-associated repeat protein